ncbi:MAG: hypothetical protein KDD04_06965, partial [Sinomicrobium sp.]|nr:hypothetical protein [Sinomicrobium sp.]
KWTTIFNYISGLAVTFIGITLGLYFTELDNEHQEKQGTLKYLEIALNDIETVRNIMVDDYRKETAKYYGKNAVQESTENFKDLRVPAPITVETIIRSSVYPKHIPARLFHKLNFCFHNLQSFKRALETQENAPELNYEQLLEDMKNYITLLSFNYFVIATELSYLKGKLTDAETAARYDEGFEKTKQALKNGKWNEFLNLQLVKDTVVIK